MRTQPFVDSVGHRRKGKQVRCNTCGTIFCTRIDQVRKYCSKRCQHIGQERKTTFTCAQCGKQFSRKSSARGRSRSGFYFCSRTCKDQAQQIGGIKEIMPTHYGTGDRNEQYRKLFHPDELVCARCGYHEFACGIDIHHLDGNHKNNAKTNLLPLCSPCHRALHYQLWRLEDILGPWLNGRAPALQAGK